MTTLTLPDGPSLPRFVPGGMAPAAPLWTMRRLRERYGSAIDIGPFAHLDFHAAVRSADGQKS